MMLKKEKEDAYINAKKYNCDIETSNLIDSKLSKIKL